MAFGFRPPKVADKFGAEVKSESRRLTGVTPRVTKSFQESPARFLPKAKGIQGGLKGMAFSRKI